MVFDRLRHSAHLRLVRYELLGALIFAGLVPYTDQKMALMGALKVDVLPTTILYDSNGREVWRMVGDKDWASADVAKLLAEAK